MKADTEAMRTRGVGRLLFLFCIPSIAGMMVNGLNNVVDRIFVGRGVGPEALAAVATVFPLILLVQALSMLVGHGAASVISLRLGEGRRQQAETVVGTATSLAVISGALVVTATGLAQEPILTLFGATAETLGPAMRFTRFLLPGLFLQTVSFTLNNMVRGQGDPITALLTMLIGAGVNCLLNPLFIFGLGLGIAGSALATDIAQAVTVSWLMIGYLRTRAGLRLRLSTLRPRWEATARIVVIGLAPAFIQLANVMTFALATNLAGTHGGSTAIAVLGIASSLLLLMLMPVIGIRQGAQPIIGYNYGARAFDRARKALRLSLLGTFLFCTVAYAFFFLLSQPIVGLFVRGVPAVVSLGVPALRIVLLAIPFVALSLIGSVYFQAINKAAPALIINLVRQLLVLVPLYFLLPRWLGLTGVWLAGPLAEVAAAILTLALLVPEMRRLNELASSPHTIDSSPHKAIVDPCYPEKPNQSCSG